jgi:hypothetical protein
MALLEQRRAVQRALVENVASSVAPLSPETRKRLHGDAHERKKGAVPQMFDFLSLRTGSVALDLASQAREDDAREASGAIMALSPTAAGMHASVAAQDSATIASNAEKILRDAARAIEAESQARQDLKKQSRQTRYVMSDSDPLIKASKRGDDEKIRELLALVEPDELIEYVNARDKNGSTPIFHTVWPGHLEALRVLLEGGADPNKQNNRHNTALHLACEREHHALILLLIQFGAHITLANLDQKRCFATLADPAARAKVSGFWT